MSQTPEPASGLTIHDVSAPLRSGLVTWPGVVERFDRRLVASFDAGDGMMVSHLSFGSHAGTHIDAPCHFLRDGGGIETISTAALIGPAEVIEVPARHDVITADVLAAAGVPGGTTRLLARTSNSGWSRDATEFDETYVAYDPSAAEWCIDRGIVLVGIDYLSIERYDADANGFPVHTALLGAGVIVLESLDLIGVSPGTYDLIALPILVPDSDGAPTRAILLGS